MRRHLTAALLFPLLASPAWSEDAAVDAAAPTLAAEADALRDYTVPSERLAARQLLSEMLGEPGRRTLRGVKALWVDVVIQSREDNQAFKTLKEDLRLSDMEGRLKKEGFKILIEGKRSLALEAKPTLLIMVLYAPARSMGPHPKAFYQVLALAKQDTARLSTDKRPLVTWAHVGAPLPSDGDDLQDAQAIRASAREAVDAFIDAAKLD